MKVRVFSIYDEKGLNYGPLMTWPHKGQALRWFMDLVRDPKTTVGTHAEDYKLYELGEFDNVSGVMVSLKTPLFLSTGSEYLDPVKK